MKKIITIFSLFVLFAPLSLFAQSIETILYELDKAGIDLSYLKDFKFSLEPNSTARYSIVLSKNTKYGISFYQNQPDQLQIDLYKNRNDNKAKSSNNDVPFNPEEFSEVKINQNITNLEYTISTTAVYHLIIKNKGNKQLNSVVILTFLNKIYPKLNKKTADDEKLMVNKKLPEKNDEPNEVFFVVEEMPQFMNKDSDEFNTFITEELKYPQEAIDNKIEGKVFVQFIVSKEGYVKNGKVARGIHPALDQEALRIIYSSPKWKPGRQRGHLVNVMFTFSVEFKLN